MLYAFSEDFSQNKHQSISKNWVCKDNTWLEIQAHYKFRFDYRRAQLVWNKMDNINYLFFVIFLPHAYLLDIIKSTYDADYGGYPVQLTTVPSNTTEKKIQAAEWWDFDEMEYNASQNNPNVQNDYVNGMESNEILSDLNSRDRINPIYLTPQNADSMLRRLTLPSMQDLKRRRKPFSFTVEGIVGSGKSTLLSAFKVSAVNLFS